MRRVVEVLILDGCPNGPVAVDHARAAMSEVVTDAELHLVVVRTVDEARTLRFLGSPSVRVDGLDVEVGAGGRRDFGLQCRVYALGDRLVGTPPTQWITEALRTSRMLEDSR